MVNLFKYSKVFKYHFTIFIHVTVKITMLTGTIINILYVLTKSIFSKRYLDFLNSFNCKNYNVKRNNNKYIICIVKVYIFQEILGFFKLVMSYNIYKHLKYRNQ